MKFKLSLRYLEMSVFFREKEKMERKRRVKNYRYANTGESILTELFGRSN